MPLITAYQKALHCRIRRDLTRFLQEDTESGVMEPGERADLFATRVIGVLQMDIENVIKWGCVNCAGCAADLDVRFDEYSRGEIFAAKTIRGRLLDHITAEQKRATDHGWRDGETTLNLVTEALTNAVRSFERAPGAAFLDTPPRNMHFRSRIG